MPFLTTQKKQDPPEMTFHEGEFGRDAICSRYSWSPAQLEHLRSASLFPVPYASKTCLIGRYLLPQQGPVWLQRQLDEWEHIVKTVLLPTKFR
jgi:hypothetical protein